MSQKDLDVSIYAKECFNARQKKKIKERFDKMSDLFVTKNKLIYVCSPFSGDVENNIKKAREYSRFVLDKGHIPLTPHLLFPQFLNDDIKEERELAMNCNFELLKRCDELWVFGDTISNGMRQEMLFVEKNGNIEIQRFIYLDGTLQWTNINMD